MATLAPKVPSLPPEIWREIIQLVPHRPLDLTSLWLDIRNVNQLCRDLVEDAFMSDHLKCTKLENEIEFECKRTWDSPNNISFAFSRLTDANRTAIFTMNKNSERYRKAGVFEDFQSRLQSLSRDNLALLPQHIIYFHSSMLINDTELPIIGMNAPMAEISIDWRSLFTGFFRDARLYQYNLKHELAKRIPNGGCWDSWDPARAEHSLCPDNTKFERHDMLTPTYYNWTVEEVRHQCFMLGFRGTHDLDLTNALSLLKSYSEINLAARVRTRRQRMKQHIVRVNWKDGVERYFGSELSAIEKIDREWIHCGIDFSQPDYRPQRWVTLRYRHQPGQAKELSSCEAKDVDRKSIPLYAGEEDIGRPQ